MKIEDSELEEVRTVAAKIEIVIEDLADAQIQYIALEGVVGSLKREFWTLLDEQERLIIMLTDKHGSGVLDIDSGEIKNI